MIEEIDAKPDKVLTQAEKAKKWWRSNCRPTEDTSLARANRAKLRRAKDWNGAVLVPAGILLVKQLGLAHKANPENDKEKEARNDRRIQSALLVAHVLAHVEKDSNVPLMRSVGFTKTPRDKSTSTEQPRLAVQRFNRLLRTSDDDLPTALIRLVRLMDGQANVKELTDVMLGWSIPWKKDRICRDWAFDYYAASDAKPETSDTIEQTQTEGTPA